MSYPFATKTSNNMLPTLELNRKLENRKNMALIMAFCFMIIEIASFTTLYFILYEYRISQEFGESINLFTTNFPRFMNYIIFFAISSLLYLFFIFRYKIYHFRSNSGLADELFKMAKSYSFAVIITIGISFLMKYTDFSRLVVIAYWFSAIVLSAVLRILKRLLYFRLANNDLVCKNVIIVGAGKVGKSLMDELTHNKSFGYKVVGFVDDHDKDDFLDIQNLGQTSELNLLLQKYIVDEIIITIPSERELVNQIIKDFRKLDIKIKIIPDLFNLVMSTVQIGNINALPVVTLVKTPMRGLGLIAKRIFDILTASVLLLMISPVFLITSLAIKLDSEGSIFYKQTRLGKNGKQFGMLKFRSMITNAEAMLKSLENQNEMDNIVFKMKDDPRVTKVGRFIRKYSIDELPQLINVIKGDMSLVGPRPPLPKEVQCYGDWEWRRLEVLPGITGLWQVSGRSDLSFNQWMNLDVYYIENWSLGLDLKILIKTIPVVLKGEGAY
ncbi:UDP-glucose:undecaprenyl-phosphate glucose-1-phosphate transferase [Paenibacillus konkukensis]|uniref:UDP-glucose:undecaprenyl-phosphate glucose-1-phosphate transferase n=1 Tax=Paenibacillus konkukensis TaxID=2020716 RepID=A0ABY4RRG6_9BACL|nr:sugar transferase [Paenibacillus konkukensis]UQZ83962.1 UDP-glucose:undecaprenyl-phosphate glucose-1-phosphate transferase [Paenibacillus konkukensis]